MTIPVHLARLLVLAVIFVNGWTDAPNAIATAVGAFLWRQRATLPERRRPVYASQPWRIQWEIWWLSLIPGPLSLY